MALENRCKEMRNTAEGIMFLLMAYNLLGKKEKKQINFIKYKKQEKHL